jgi:asparagine synthase (glutamine-hydrolysing)
MCGIAGIVSENSCPPNVLALEAILKRMTHRGPDDSGVWTRGSAALGHRRLSIIDLQTGHQPMCNEDGTVWITFNGEIYNFGELRRDLEKAGHRFASASDTETIIHAYEQYGVDCLSHFRGMFAFGIWSEPTRTLLLARDRLGKKPLFYSQQSGWLAFASELQALVAHPEITRQPDPEAIDHYLAFGYIPAPQTIYRRVYKLPPGHFLLAKLSEGRSILSVRVAPWWRLRYDSERVMSDEDAAEGLLSLLKDAVRVRLTADVPVGVLLSGGTDSSIVTALASRLHSGRIKTFSIGFAEQEYNELPFARAVAERYSTDHHELIVRPRLLDVLPALVRHYGEPYADSSAVPTYYVTQMAGQHVTVVLNGDGGDECLAGYDRYLGSAVAEQYCALPQGVRSRIIEPAARWLPESASRFFRLRQVRRFLEVAGWPWTERYVHWMSYFALSQRQQLYGKEMLCQLNGHCAESWLADLVSRHTGTHGRTVNALLATDLDSYLPNDLLVKMDIAAMANSVEGRSPFLDHKVVEYCARLPVRCKIRGATRKYLLRKIASDLVPRPNIQRRKMGFGIPLGEWMRSEHKGFLEDVLLGCHARRRGLFQPEGVRRLLNEHITGIQNHAQRLWALVWLELWFRTFID